MARKPFLDAARGAFKGETVPFPEFGRTATVRPLSEAAAEDIRVAVRDADGNVDGQKFIERMIVACASDEDDKPLAATHAELAKALTSIPYQRLVAAVLRVNGRAEKND